MYINDVIYDTDFSEKIEINFLTERVKLYFNDLYKRYKMDLNMNLEKPVYRYDQMGEYLLSQISRKSNFTELDTIAFPSWSISWNMDYAVTELYWKNKFNLKAPFLDIRDCGSLCVFNAVAILLKLYEMKIIKKFLCCTIENKFLFLNEEEKMVAPMINYIGAFIFSETRSTKLIKILYSKILQKTHFKTENELLVFFRFFLESQRISEDSCQFYIRKYDIAFSFDFFHAISHPDSSGFIYYCIKNVLKNYDEIRLKYALIVDFDFSIGSTGILLLAIK